MAAIEYDILKKVYENKKYVFFSEGKFNLNIFGVRSKIKIADSYDDWIGVAYLNENNQKVCEAFTATTDAGTYWLKNPMQRKGTALLVPNQYRSAYKIGYHRGEYIALVQDKPLKVYRDNNKNQILDFDPATVEEGIYGINIHRSSPSVRSQQVQKWSAGCQVFQSPTDFNKFIELCQKSRNLYGNSFTYTLLTEEDFNAL